MRSMYQMLANRRKFERVRISGTVRTVAPGSTAPHVCTCVDISPRGMAIDSPEPLARDMDVPILSEGIKRFARVRYCQDRGQGYRIGLEFVAAESSTLRDQLTPM